MMPLNPAISIVTGGRAVFCIVPSAVPPVVAFLTMLKGAIAEP